jgi:16S rRNA (cytosine967-C5)-methyltransferase
MNLAPGQHVIDLCAGVGTKATQIAEILDNRGAVLACDRDESKLVRLRENCERLGLNIVQTVGPGEIDRAAARLEHVDWILIDAPCSNSGVLARRPEARYRISRQSLAALAAVQSELLDLACRLSSGETRLLYSTCSIDPSENEDVIRRFASGHPGWRLSESRLILPDAPTRPLDWRDGGFRAVLVQAT